MLHNHARLLVHHVVPAHGGWLRRSYEVKFQGLATINWRVETVGYHLCIGTGFPQTSACALPSNLLSSSGRDAIVALNVQALNNRALWTVEGNLAMIHVMRTMYCRLLRHSGYAKYFLGGVVSVFWIRHEEQK